MGREADFSDGPSFCGCPPVRTMVGPLRATGLPRLLPLALVAFFRAREGDVSFRGGMSGRRLGLLERLRCTGWFGAVVVGEGEGERRLVRSISGTVTSPTLECTLRLATTGEDSPTTADERGLRDAYCSSGHVGKVKVRARMKQKHYK